jgi:hypothetical protein
VKVVINSCFGGFSISRKAVEKMREWGNEYALYETLPGERWKDTGEINDGGLLSRWDSYYLRGEAGQIPRNDPHLVRVVEELGGDANGACAKLKIVEIPDDVEWEIAEYDGSEHVAQVHQTWS